MVSHHLWEESCPTCSVQTESETWLLDPAQQTRADIPSRAVSPEVVSRVYRVTRAPRLGRKGMGSCTSALPFRHQPVWQCERPVSTPTFDIAVAPNLGGPIVHGRWSGWPRRRVILG